MHFIILCLATGNNLNKEKNNSKYLLIPHAQNNNLDSRFLKKKKLIVL